MNAKTTSGLKYITFWLVIGMCGTVALQAVPRVVEPAFHTIYSIATMFLIGLVARLLKPFTLLKR